MGNTVNNSFGETEHVDWQDSNVPGAGTPAQMDAVAYLQYKHPPPVNLNALKDFTGNDALEVAVLAGDPEARNYVIGRLQGIIKEIIHKICPAVLSPEDLHQNVNLALLRGNTLNAVIVLRGETMKAYIYGIINHHVQKAYRQKMTAEKKTRLLENATRIQEEDAHATAAEKSPDIYALNALRTAIMNLMGKFVHKQHAKRREVLTGILGGLADREIAAYTGINFSTINTCRRLIIAALKEEMEMSIAKKDYERQKTNFNSSEMKRKKAKPKTREKK